MTDTDSQTQTDVPDRWTAVSARAAELNRREQRTAAFRILHLIHGISAVGAAVFLAGLVTDHRLGDRPAWYLALALVAATSASVSALSNWILRSTPLWLPALASLSIIATIAMNTRSSLILWANVFSFVLIYRIYKNRGALKSA